MATFLGKMHVPSKQNTSLKATVFFNNRNSSVAEYQVISTASFEDGTLPSKKLRCPLCGK